MKHSIAFVLSLLLLQACDTNNQEVSDRQAEVTDFESTKARAKAGNAAAQYQVAFLSISESLRWKRAIKKKSSFIFKLHHNDGK